MKEKKLGKGLDFLLNLSKPEPSGEKSDLKDIKVHLIDANRHQPRIQMDEVSLNELKESISENGLLQPIVVKRFGERYELVAGERRFRAFQALDKETIPAIIVDIPDNKLLELAIIENIQRENLNPIEEAKAFKSMIELENISHEELAKRVGKNRSTITNSLRLLELPETIQESVSRGTISQGHARALLSLQTHAEMLAAYEKVIEEKLSVRQLEKISQSKRNNKKVSPKKTIDHNIQSHIDSLQEKYHTKVDISLNNETGSIRFNFYSSDDYNQLLNKLLHL